MLQCDAVRCSALQCLAVRCSALHNVAVCRSMLQRVVMCCSALQCVAVRCSALQCAAVCCIVLQYVAACCIALHCVPKHVCPDSFFSISYFEAQMFHKLLKITLRSVRFAESYWNRIRHCIGWRRSGWRRPIGCRIVIELFPQIIPMISGTFAESDLRVKASYELYLISRTSDA